MDKFMRRAVDLSLENISEGGQPFGAVLVKDGKVISEGVNETHKKHDVSGHAEMIAIRKAQEMLKTDYLKGYIMYASGEPCPMCYTAMYYVGIEKAFYCSTVKEVSEAGLNASSILYKDLKKNTANRETIQMIHIPLEEYDVNPMKSW